MCPSPPALTGAPVVTDVAGGAVCPERVCPQYYECKCDAQGRLVYAEHTFSGVPKDRYWIDRDGAGRHIEVRRDYDANGRIDARSVYARGEGGGCAIETRDDDADGAGETVCVYEDDCITGLSDCRPVSCAPAVHDYVGALCAPETCPRGATCSCDPQGRVVEALYNRDEDDAFEARTVMVYSDDDALVDEQRSYSRGALTATVTMTYDHAGRMLTQATDQPAGGAVEREVRWTWGKSDGWLSMETWTQGKLASRHTRTYDAADRVVTETREVPGSTPLEMRYFPGEGDDVAQPVVISSDQIAERQVACNADADCVVVPGVNCCSCSSGGIGAVLHRRHARTLRRNLRRTCGEVNTCLAVISNHPTCLSSMKPACVQNFCTMRAN